VTTRPAALFAPLHKALVQRPRTARLAPVLASLGSPAQTLLDVGAGDGALGLAVAQRLSARAAGVDVKVQPGAALEVTPFDGETLPFPDATFDVVLLSDVLHHARSAERLLEEALRVCRRAVVLKDHFQLGVGARWLLTLMDLAGNRPYGIDVLGRYLTPREWLELFARTGARVRELVWPLDVHAAPLRAVLRSEVQFAARLERERGPA
jgi:SAM-dependent methyltransferase